MKLTEITPLILTYNEQANLKRTLSGLLWAKQILIVDSFSTDETLRIASEYPQVRVVQRKFDHFAEQCNFGLAQIETPWVLSLDADYVCDDAFARELATLDDTLAGFAASFKYGIYGRVLNGSLYPPRIVLYRRESANYVRDGHAHRVSINGKTGSLRTPILHDDHKPLSSWLQSQLRYAETEADKLLSHDSSPMGWKDRIRKGLVFAPFLTLVYCLIVKRLILNGWPGFFYTMQRVFAELTLSLVLLERKLK